MDVTASRKTGSAGRLALQKAESCKVGRSLRLSRVIFSGLLGEDWGMTSECRRSGSVTASFPSIFCICGSAVRPEDDAVDGWLLDGTARTEPGPPWESTAWTPATTIARLRIVWRIVLVLVLDGYSKGKLFPRTRTRTRRRRRRRRRIRVLNTSLKSGVGGGAAEVGGVVGMGGVGVIVWVARAAVEIGRRVHGGRPAGR